MMITLDNVIQVIFSIIRHDMHHIIILIIWHIIIHNMLYIIIYAIYILLFLLY